MRKMNGGRKKRKMKSERIGDKVKGEKERWIGQWMETERRGVE